MVIIRWGSPINIRLIWIFQPHLYIPCNLYMDSYICRISHHLQFVIFSFVSLSSIWVSISKTYVKILLVISKVNLVIWLSYLILPGFVWMGNQINTFSLKIGSRGRTSQEKFRSECFLLQKQWRGICVVRGLHEHLTLPK